MNIEIWSIGKSNDNFIEQGIQYYFKKIKPYCKIKLEVIQYKKNIQGDPERCKLLEEELILKKIAAQDTLVLLDERGQLLSSPQVADLLQNYMNTSKKRVIFLIGGAYGVSENIRKRANKVWSFSHLVFPHQLMRILVAEQIYRGYSILNNLPYHHE